MDEQEFLEAFLALYAFSTCFLLTGIGAVLTSTNDFFYWFYVNYDPPEDMIFIMVLLIGNFFILTYLLGKAHHFGKSRNLNFRRGELMSAMDKMKIYTLIIYLPIQIFIAYFCIKYSDTAIFIYLFFMLLCNLGLFFLIFYNSISMKREYEQDKLDRFT